MNKTIGVIGSCLLLMVMVVTAVTSQEGDKIYRNEDFGYSVNYSPEFQAKEIKWVKEKMGIELRRKGAVLTVQAMPSGADYAKMTFDQYVRIAASAEIQNFNKLLSIEPFISDYGIKGYRTFWEVTDHEDTDNGSIDSTRTAGPIYYFPLKRSQKLGQQPIKTVTISADPALSSEAEAIARTYRFLTSYQTLFRKSAGGKLYFVKQGKPFRIELDENATTGYTWQISDLDEKRFKVLNSGYQTERTGRVGAGGVAYWEIEPRQSGWSTIRLDCYRPWEGKGKAIDSFLVRVLIAR